MIRLAEQGVGPRRLAWQAATAESAELVSEPLSLRYLECANVLLAAEPLECRGLEENIGRVPGACCLATPRAMAVIEALCLAGNLILRGTAQAPTLQDDLAHGSSVERQRYRID